MDKVVLPREVAEAVNHFIARGEYPVRYALDAIYGVRPARMDAEKVIVEFCNSDRTRRIETILKAFFKGYEIEETPEDKVFKLFSEWLDKRESARIREDFEAFHNFAQLILGMLKTLERLGITIKGVNDHDGC